MRRKGRERKEEGEAGQMFEHPIVVGFSGTLTFEDGNGGITLLYL